MKELLDLLSDSEVKESLKEIIPSKLFLLNNLIEDIKKAVNPTKIDFDNFMSAVNEKQAARDLLKDELKDHAFYSAYDKRFFYHLDQTPSIEINIEKGFSIFVDASALNLTHEDLWKVLRKIKGVNIYSIDLDIE